MCAPGVLIHPEEYPFHIPTNPLSAFDAYNQYIRMLNTDGLWPGSGKSTVYLRIPDLEQNACHVHSHVL